MNKRWKILLLVAVFIGAGVFVSPAMARRYDTPLFGYHRWTVVDYRYYSWITPNSVALKAAVMRDKKEIELSERSVFDHIDAIFGAFNLIGESKEPPIGTETSK